ncbi:MAG: GAF domain-containing protein [Actinomycetota bacterium]
MAGERHANLLAKLAPLGYEGSPIQQLCTGSVGLLDVEGAAFILMSEKETGSLAAIAGARTSRVEDLQFTLGEGPCLESFRSGHPVLEPELLDGARSRWPVFVEGAAALGARAVFALPLQIGAARLGVLYLYREEPGLLSAERFADAFAIADIGTWILLGMQAGAVPGELGDGLDGSWAYRAVVHQASGMISARLGMNLIDALARLRALAFAADRSIYEVAADVAARRIEVLR